MQSTKGDENADQISSRPRRGLPVVASGKIADRNTLEALDMIRTMSTPQPTGDLQAKKSASRSRRERRRRNKNAQTSSPLAVKPPNVVYADASAPPPVPPAVFPSDTGVTTSANEQQVPTMADVSRFASPEYARMLSNSSSMADAAIKLAAVKSGIAPRKIRKLLARKGVNVDSLMQGALPQATRR